MTNSVPVNVPTISEAVRDHIDGTRVAIALADAAPAMYKALCVLLLADHIRKYLITNDPMAFEQAEQALQSVGGWSTVDERAAALGPWLNNWR